MYRLHIDDLRHSMPHDHFAYLRLWLERSGAAIVAPDQVREPHHSMGNFALRPGRFGQDEPWPPYEPTRQIIEDARDKRPGA